MVRHTLTALPFLAFGAALVAYCAHRFDKLRSARTFLVAFPVMVVVIAAISGSSTKTEVRCLDDPNEFCIYNDSTPLIAVFAFLFLAACCVKSWLLYSER